MIQSIAIITKTGKIIVARQNIPLARTKVEGLYATFLRLVGSNPYTSFEAESVRFVYRLLEDVYVVLITTLSSNIIEDQEIMNAIIACIQQKMTITSKTMTQGMYEVLFIIDEFIQWGHAEKLTVQQARTNLSMKSRDEELYLHQLELKKQEAARIAKQKEEEIREEKELREKLEMMQRMQNNSMFTDMKRQMNDGYSPLQDYHTGTTETTPSQQQPIQQKKTVKKTTKQVTKGLQLGKKKTTEAFIEEIKKEEHIEEEEERKPIEQTKQSIQRTQPKEKKLMLTSCIVKVIEDSHIIYNTESSTVSLTINGSLAIATAEGILPEIHLGPVGIVAKAQMNPAIDSKAFSERIVKVKEGKKFAVNTPATYIKWNYKSTDYELPITFTCWPAESDTGVTLSLSYECNQSLKNVSLSIPKIGNVMINTIENGTLEENETIQWILGNVDEGSSGSLEIEIEGNDLDVSLLFPMNVNWLVEKTMTGNDVEHVLVDGSPIEFEKEILLHTSYQIMP